MKSKKFLKISIFFIVLLFFVSSTNSILSDQGNYNFKGISPRTIGDFNKLKHSSYWTLPNIHITNWTTTNMTYDWCNYENGYYIIENVSITGVDGKNGIRIENTTENFIIRNCQINEGVQLWRVKSGQIINNTIYFGYSYGLGVGNQIAIYMNYCSNTTIRNNFINDTYSGSFNLIYGFLMYLCNNITLVENYLFTFNNRYSRGVSLQGGDHIKVINNTIHNFDIGIDNHAVKLSKVIYNNVYNSRNGIIVHGNNHIISNNTIKNSLLRGIYSFGSNHSIFNNKLVENERGIEVRRASYNIICNNSIQDSSDYGIYFEESNYNNITNNNIQKSEKYGIYLESSNHSIITGNYITYKIGCIKEVNCYGNFISDNVCIKIPGLIFGYYPLLVLGILSMTIFLIIKFKLKKYD